MKNIIVSGCSYSQKSGVKYSYADIIQETTNHNVSNLAWPGQSNDTIIRNIKKKIREGVSDTMFICQLTHLHRVSHYCTLNKKWLDFQPAIVNVEPIIKDTKIEFKVKTYSDNDKRPPIGSRNVTTLGVYGAENWKDNKLSKNVMENLLDWYETYLTHLYDEENAFHELSYMISELTKQVKDSGNDIMYLYWPDVNYDSSLFEKNNFISIDGEYSMLRWSFKKKIAKEDDSHLTQNGMIELSKEICNYINIPYITFVEPLI